MHAMTPLRIYFHKTALSLIAVLLAHCGKSEAPAKASSADEPSCEELAAQLESEMSATLDTVAADTTITSDPNFAVLLKADDGREYTHACGSSSLSQSYESASTSKWVAAVVILTEVDRGSLSLDSNAADVLGSFWSDAYPVTLRHLLSLTSGFSREACALGSPPCSIQCVDLPNRDFADCVRDIYDANVIAVPALAGTEFYYSPNHLQIAGLMATTSSAHSSWAQLFAQFQNTTGLFVSSAFDLPSATNPRLAGGMHWTAEDYLTFLWALYKNERPSDRGPFLTTSSWDELFKNQRGSAAVAASPIWDRLQEDWAYGLGNWLECSTAKAQGSFDCTSRHLHSSPGAYGSYPFIDFDAGYMGIVARASTDLGSFPEGIALLEQIRPLAESWAALPCNP